MMKSKRFMALLLSFAVLFCFMPAMTYADTTAGEPETQPTGTAVFTDMPDDWSTDALTKAVANGLIKGYETKTGMEIQASGNLTRAELATVINRAFGAAETAGLTGVEDVPIIEWFYDDMQKAVAMGTMVLDKKMRPNDNITRQEAFTVIARALGMAKEINDSASILAKFTDSGDVASWAAAPVAALVAAEYVSGSDNKLNPTANITRAEFSVIMDNCIKTYIKEAGNVDSQAYSGNVMVNVPGVTLSGITVDGSLILGDGIGTGEVAIDKSSVSGDIVVRGGGTNSITITSSTIGGKVKISHSTSTGTRVEAVGTEVKVEVLENGIEGLILDGEIASVEIAAENAAVTIAETAKVENLIVATVASEAEVTIKGTVTKVETAAAGAAVTVEETAKVDNIVVAPEAVKTEIAVAGTVKTVETSAPETAVSGTGTVSKVSAKDGADNTSVTTPSTAVTASAGVTGVTAGGNTTVEPGSTATNNSSGTGATGATPPSGGGGGGGSSAPNTGTITIDAPSTISSTNLSTATVAVTGSGFTASASYSISATVTDSDSHSAAFTGTMTGAELNALSGSKTLTQLLSALGISSPSDAGKGSYTSGNAQQMFEFYFGLAHGEVTIALSGNYVTFSPSSTITVTKS